MKITWHIIVLLSMACCGLVGLSPVALAQGEDSSKRAGELFDQGLKDMLAGHYESGCPALAESYQLEPMAGALFTLAECERKWGKNATALAHYEQYLEQLETLPEDKKKKQAVRADIAKQQVAELEGKVARLRITLPASAPAGTQVELDGEALDEAVVGTAQPVEPGAHKVTLRAPGQEPSEQDVELRAGEYRRLELEVDSSEEDEDGSDGSRKLYGQVGAGLGIGIPTAGLGVGPMMFVEGGVLYRLGPGSLSGSFRLGFETFSTDGEGQQPCPSGSPCVAADGGSYGYDVNEKTLSLGWPLGYHFLTPEDVFIPYVVVVPTVYLLEATSTTYDTENTQTDTQFGVAAILGGQLSAGPGGVFLELGYHYAALSHSITGDSSLSAFSAELGYRFIL